MVPSTVNTIFLPVPDYLFRCDLLSLHSAIDQQGCR